MPTTRRFIEHEELNPACAGTATNLSEELERHITANEDRAGLRAARFDMRVDYICLARARIEAGQGGAAHAAPI